VEKNTVKNYQLFLSKFKDQFGDKDIEDVTPDKILSFLNRYTEGQKQSTKRFKYTLLKSFLERAEKK
jgi:site-specific recombinase XerD